MSGKSILITGNGGHAVSCREVIESVEDLVFSGFVTKDGTDNGPEVIGTDRDLESIFQNTKLACVGMGQIKTNEHRVKSFNKLKQIGYTLPIIIASTAYVADSAKIHEGTIIMHRAFVNSQTIIGINSIINTGAIVEHGANVGNHCHVATKVTINGDAIIGDNSFIGSGATVLQGVNIGENCIVGAGVIVKKDLERGSILK